MSYIYINEQGSEITVDGGHCVVTKPDGMRRIIPIETIEYVSLFGNIKIYNFRLKCYENVRSSLQVAD